MQDITERREDEIIDLGAATDQTNGAFDVIENEGTLKPQRKSN